MHSDWFNGIDIFQGRWQHGEKVGYFYPSGLEKTLCKWEIYVPLVTKGLKTDLAKIVSLLSCPRPRQFYRIGRLHLLENRATAPVIKDIIKETDRQTDTSTIRVILVNVLLLSEQK
jgi:hypothetical protein